MITIIQYIVIIYIYIYINVSTVSSVSGKSSATLLPVGMALTKLESLSQTSIGAVGDGDQTRWLVLMRAAERICSAAEWYRKHISANAKAGLHAKLQENR